MAARAAELPTATPGCEIFTRAKGVSWAGERLPSQLLLVLALGLALACGLVLILGLVLYCTLNIYIY